MNNKGLATTIWVIVFLLVFALSLDYWNWDKTVIISYLGLPGWIYYFVLLQILFITVLIVFTKIYWRDDE
ncbi:MAG: hypothetical protein IIA45_13125 [Bacteroidetes bacterium]|nr:hypothetical protein [Bacteroidota bacterium]